YENRKLKHIYVAATLHAAILAAELADGKENNERIYLVEATGPVEDDPNVTDKKFPANPTLSYRSQHPFKVIGEVSRWKGHTMEKVTAIKQHLKKCKEVGEDVILDARTSKQANRPRTVKCSVVEIHNRCIAVETFNPAVLFYYEHSPTAGPVSERIARRTTVSNRSSQKSIVIAHF